MHWTRLQILATERYK